MAVELQQMHSVNPATEERIATYPVHSERDVDAALDAAMARRSSWRGDPDRGPLRADVQGR